MLISRRTTIKGLVASTFAFDIPYALIGAANAGEEHPIMRAIRKSEHGLGRVKRCKNDPNVAKFTVDMTQYAKDGLSITSDYGSSYTSRCNIRRNIPRGSFSAWESPGNNGFDIWAPQGTPVIAAIDGRISISHFDENSGNGIRIQSENAAIWPEYLHLDKRLVKVGDTVRRGDIIGTVGSTGTSVYGGSPYLQFTAVENFGSFTTPHPYWIKSDPNLVLAAAFGDETKEKARVTLYRPGQVYDIPAGDHRVLTYPIPGLKDMPHFLDLLEKMKRKK